MNGAEVVTSRHNAMIDPSLHIWGWEIPVYLFLGGLAAGIMLLSAVSALRRGEERPSRAWQVAPFLALLALSVGMLALFLDLEYKLHVYRFYLALRPSSPMSWGSWILILVYPVGLLLGAASLDPEVRAKVLQSRIVAGLRLGAPLMCIFGRADTFRRAVAWASLIVAAGLGVYTGILLGAMAAEPLWNTPILGPLFLASGVSSGAAFLMLLPISEAERHMAIRWDIGAIVAEFVLLGLMLVGFATGSEAEQGALEALVSGPHASAFWTIVVLAGLLVPLAIEALEVRAKLRPIMAAPLLVLAGGFALRWIVVVAGQASSLTNRF